MSINNNNSNNFAWRPNDNSSTTLLRYELEAEHWVRAFKSAEMSSKGGENATGEYFAVIGFVIDLIFNIILLLVNLIVYIIKLITNAEGKAKLRDKKIRRYERLKKEERQIEQEKFNNWVAELS